MYYLIYRSVATEVPTKESLARLLELAREQNASRGITGMLLYQNGRYMQMLEGEETKVRELFDAIANDPRHRLVKVVATGNNPKRHFQDWSMGFRDMEQVGSMPDYDTYLARQLDLDRFHGEERAAFQFMLHFVESA